MAVVPGGGGYFCRRGSSAGQGFVGVRYSEVLELRPRGIGHSIGTGILRPTTLNRVSSLH